jgi:hypothetical protein
MRVGAALMGIGTDGKPHSTYKPAVQIYPNNHHCPSSRRIPGSAAPDFGTPLDVV